MTDNPEGRIVTPLHITFVISTLDGGGAERSLVNIAETLNQRGYQVFVVTLYGREFDCYSLSPDISRVALGLAKTFRSPFHALCNNLRRIWALRLVISKSSPDFVISFQDRMNLLVLLAMQGIDLPVVVVEHAEPTKVDIGVWRRRLRRWLYPSAARVVSVSAGVDHYFEWLPASRHIVIYNSITNGAQAAQTTKKPVFIHSESKHIVAMGRLAEEKGFDLLLEAFSRIAQQNPDWDLVILGEGEKRTELEAQIKELCLEERAVLLGRLADPFPVLRSADLFVLSSHFESFGNVLVEAMACGLPIISFDCPSGPREIIRDGIDGILVPPEDVRALATAMDCLMNDETKRRQFVASAREVIHRFDVETITDQWEELMKAVLRERGNKEAQ